ncbi:histidine phosphatase superfamily [Thamnocephalis sphaerospora]|uniref:Histidine phosphatase superfamily n=1 Tax=Thamnocephalis sphaerospora TaxID=78915 RepID=A0A4P9XNP0_9FUNG|nr:histidine phosphatase superfamily [Thamnocephalis sphaerospora]|eukprot:RKP07578.1 histidine phosphatase superfamily [Thamnocephalis sphaerospora]
MSPTTATNASNDKTPALLRRTLFHSKAPTIAAFLALLLATGLSWYMGVPVGLLKRPHTSYAPPTDDDYTLCEAKTPDHTTYRTLPGAQLVHIQVVTRHGDRTPAMAILPNEQADWRCDNAEEVTQLADSSTDASDAKDSEHAQRIGAYQRRVVVPKRPAYRNTVWSSGSCSLGQLTLKGVRQHKALGEQLRAIYVDHLKVLPERLNASTLSAQLYARSSDVQRTRQSAAALLTGLWPLKVRDPDARIIPLHVYPEEAETLWGHPNDCPRAASVVHAVRSSPEYEAYLERHAPLRTRLESLLGTSGIGKYERSFLRYLDPIYPRVCHDMPLPCGESGCVTRADAEELAHCVSEEYTILRGTHTHAAEYNRLTLGFFLGELRDRMMAAIHADAARHTDTAKQHTVQSPMFELFSAHDTTIYGLIGALKAKDMRWPPYASIATESAFDSDDARLLTS